MFRSVRSIGIALVSVGVVIAAPVGVADAATVPTARIRSGDVVVGSSDERLPPPPGLACSSGRTIELSGDVSIPGDGKALRYEWSASKGGSVGANPADFSFPCNYVGTNTIRLTVTDDLGLSSTATIAVPIDGPPTVAITPGGGPRPKTQVVATGSTVTFTADAADPVGNPLTYKWSAAGASSSTGVQDSTGTKFSLTCAKEETNTVKVIVTDTDKQTATDSATVKCVNQPTGAFDPAPLESGERTVVALGSTIKFRAANRGSSMSYQWRTSGVSGVASPKSEFTRTFDKVGIVGVELIEYNELGRSKQRVEYLVIGPPTATIWPVPWGHNERIAVWKGTTINFDGSASSSPGGGKLEYQWRTSGVSGVAGSDVQFPRRFDTVGNVGVELIVIDQLGQRSKHRVEVTVLDPHGYCCWRR